MVKNDVFENGKDTDDLVPAPEKPKKKRKAMSDAQKEAFKLRMN